MDREGKFPETLWDFANVVMDVASLVSNIKDHNTGAAIADGVGLVADAFAAAIPFLPAGAGAALKAVRGGEKVADAVKTVDKVGDATKVIERTETVASQGKYGSYTITFESGMKYHGKGPKSRMERSIKENLNYMAIGQSHQSGHLQPQREILLSTKLFALEEMVVLEWNMVTIIKSIHRVKKCCVKKKLEDNATC